MIDQIACKVGERAAVAVVDGSRLKPTEFLTAVLTEFGYDLELNSVDELVNMLNVFAVQQARTREAITRILGDQGGKGCLPILGNALLQGDRATRRVAAKALSRLPEKTAKPFGGVCLNNLRC